jgi:Flp pilus assembly CpaE family ATPase
LVSIVFQAALASCSKPEKFQTAESLIHLPNACHSRVIQSNFISAGEGMADIHAVLATNELISRDELGPRADQTDQERRFPRIAIVGLRRGTGGTDVRVPHEQFM